jgi:transposase InsO family protein
MLRLLHDLGLSWQKARPVHPAADRQAQEAFKKVPAVIAEVARGHPEAGRLEVWFLDEARVGPTGRLCRRWFEKGMRPRGVRDLRHQAAYRFGAVCPERDAGVALVLPTVSAAAMQAMLDELGQAVSPGAHGVVLMDRAGWHIARELEIPANLTPVILLPVWKGLELSARGVAVWTGEDSHETPQVETRAEGADRARRAQGPGRSASCAPSTRSARASTISGATCSWPTPRKRSSRPAPHHVRAGSNAKTRGSRPWSGNSPWSSKKARRSSGEARPLRQGGGAQCEPPRADQSAQGRPPVLGLSAGLGLSALRRRPGGQSETRLRHHEDQRAADEPEPQTAGQAQSGYREAAADAAERMVGIDMTKVMIEGFGWVCLVVVLDWHSKKVVGHYAGLQARAWHWLVALNRAVNRQFPHGIEGHRLNLMADNGCQPTSLAFLRACAALGIRQAFTSYSNPKGNADTERFLRTLKEELVWLREWTSPAAFFVALERWFVDYNATYFHSALGYRAPNAFEAKHLSRATPLAAAC